MNTDASVSGVVANHFDQLDWRVEIGEHPTSQTVVLEVSDPTLTGAVSNKWRPINGRRVKGPGPSIGAVYTNACAGGPATFIGKTDGFKALRVRCTIYSGVPIQINGTIGPLRFIGLLTGIVDDYMFVIDEEPTIEDLLKTVT